MRKPLLLPFLVFAFGCSDNALVDPLDGPTTDLVITAASQSQQKNLFRDDFEDGDAQGWGLGPGDAWSVDADDGNYVLSSSTGEETALAFLQHPGWYDFVFQTRVKFVSGNVYCELLLRVDDEGQHYWVQITEFGWIALAKENLTGYFEWLAIEDMNFVRNVWYDFRVVVNHNRIIVTVDGSPKINVNDPNPWPNRGTIGFEVHDNTHVLFDDVLVAGGPSVN